MQMLTERWTDGRIWDAVGGTSRRALLLDYDGTLAPFRVERDAAVPYAGVRPILQQIIAAGHTRLVVISGRVIADVQRLLALDAPYEIWGGHGWERQLADGTLQSADLAPDVTAALDRADAWVVAHHLQSRVERKPASIALHLRGLAPKQATELRDVTLKDWQELGAPLTPHTFDGGIELRATGHDKGSAVRTVLEEIGADAFIAFLGDDLTDEDAFAALAGRGLSVLVRSELRPTVADLWLRPPDELVAFLERWRAVARGERGSREALTP